MHCSELITDSLRADFRFSKCNNRGFGIRTGGEKIQKITNREGTIVRYSRVSIFKV